MLERLMMMMMMTTIIVNEIFNFFQSSSSFVPLAVTQSNYRFPEFKVKCLF